MNLGHIIRVGRVRKNLEQRQLAEMLGVAQSAVSSWESGKSIPSGDILIKLARDLDIVEELFPGYGKIVHTPTPAEDSSKVDTRTRQEIQDIVRKELESFKKKISVIPDALSAATMETISKVSHLFKSVPPELLVLVVLGALLQGDENKSTPSHKKKD